jgi:hypothetical protein
VGVFGIGIFAEDLARDIRAIFRQKIGDGLSAEKATDSLLGEMSDGLRDDETRSVFWLALAATESDCGRLEERTKLEALRIIAQGTDLPRWEGNSRLLAKRRAVLDRLRLRLEGPQRSPSRIPKTFRSTCDWEVGEVVAFRLRSGNFVAFRIIGHHTDSGGTSPKCEFLDWSGRVCPSASDLMDATARRGVPPRNQIAFILCQLRRSDIPTDRIFRLGFKVRPPQNSITVGGAKPRSIHDLFNPALSIGAILWRSIDQELKAIFGLV